MPDASTPPLNTPPCTTISTMPDGPLIIRGAISVDGVRKLGCALCRCGLSQNKPYCDQSHKRANWKDGSTPTTPTEPQS